jgi:WD40 repeat protein
MSTRIVTAAQDGVRNVVAAAASGRSGHRWVAPLAAAAAVAAAACAPIAWPLLAGAAGGSVALTAAFGQVGGVGGGLLAEVVIRAWDRLQKRKGSGVEQSDLQEALAAELRQALGSSSPMAAGLRAEVASVLQGVDAVRVALTATVETAVRESGDRVRAVLISGLQDLGTRFTEFGWLLGEVNDQVARIAETQAEIAAGTRALLEAQQQTLMQFTILRQQIRSPHIEDAGPASPPESTGISADQLRAAELDAAGVPVSSQCPYPGLAAFRQQDADRFFGRQQLTATLVTRLAEQLTMPGLLMVLGPSGSGKSSLLKAGLLRAIAAGGLPARESQTWPLDVMTPGQHPLLELATRIASVAGIPAGALNADLRADPTRITAAIRQALLAHSRREIQSSGDRRSAAVIDVDTADAIGSGLPVGGARSAMNQAASVGRGEVVASPRLVLIVDQFEEVFTADDSERQAFIRALCAAAGTNAATAPAPGYDRRSPSLLSSRDAPALVVVGMRADFYARSAIYQELVPYLQDHQVLVGPMDEAGLRDAIERPAASAGLVVEDGLVEVLLADLGLQPRPADPIVPADEPDGTAVSEAGNGYASAAGGSYEAGRLPLLAYALQQTWQHRQGRRLTVAAYRATGGIDGAVARAADTVYDRLDTDGRKAAQQLLLRLVSLGEGTADTRRRVAVTELTGTTELPEFAVTPQAATARAVLADLIQARLLTADTDTDGSDTVEISHEALLSAWPKLHEWLSQDRSGQRTHRELTDAAHGWLAHGRDPSRLFGGTRLAVTREWAASHEQDLNPDERAFLDACKKHERAARRRRITNAALVGVLVLLVFVTATYLTTRLAQEAGQARKDHLQAIYSQINAEAGLLQITDPSLAGQLHLVAYRIDPTSFNYSLLLAAANIPLVNQLTGPTGPVRKTTFSPPGRIVAIGSGDTVQLWDVTDPARPALLRHPLTSAKNAVNDVRFSPDGHIVAIGSGDTVQLWDVTNPARPALLRHPLTGATGHTPISAVAFSPDGHMAAVGGVDGTVRLWNIINPTHPIPLGILTGPANAINTVTFTPNGHTLVASSLDGTIRLWDLRNSAPAQIAAPLTSTGSIFAVALSPDGHMLAVGTSDGTVRLWNVTNPARISPIGQLLTVTANAVNTVAFSPNGETLVAGSNDGTLRLWNVANPAHATAIGLPVVDASPVLSVAFSPNGFTMAVGSQDGIAKLWNLNASYAIERICTSGKLTRQQWAAYISELPYDPPCSHP